MKEHDNLRKLLIPLLLLLCMTASAQHMKFMGIPIDGTINAFTAKLQAKGLRISPLNKYLEPGSRYLEGTFFGRKADFYVYYDPATKIAYRAKAVIEGNDFDYLKSIYDEISSVIEEKYKETHKEDTHKGYIAVSYLIDLGTSSNHYEGKIDLYFSKNTYGKFEYSLDIDYYDCVNTTKYENSRNKDI